MIRPTSRAGTTKSIPLWLAAVIAAVTYVSINYFPVIAMTVLVSIFGLTGTVLLYAKKRGRRR